MTGKMDVVLHRYGWELITPHKFFIGAAQSMFTCTGSGILLTLGMASARFDSSRTNKIHNLKGL